MLESGEGGDRGIEKRKKQETKPLKGLELIRWLDEQS